MGGAGELELFELQTYNTVWPKYVTGGRVVRDISALKCCTRHLPIFQYSAVSLDNSCTVRVGFGATRILQQMYAHSPRSFDTTCICPSFLFCSVFGLYDH